MEHLNFTKEYDRIHDKQLLSEYQVKKQAHKALTPVILAQGGAIWNIQLQIPFSMF